MLVALGAFAGVHAQDPDIRTTEEGQRVIFDRFTWQRRELDKRLALDQPWPSDAEINGAFAKYGLDKNAPPVVIPVPKKVTGSVYLVGSTITLTWLIDCGPAGVAIVDPGLQGNYEGILANVEKAGFSRSSIKWVLNTHAHFDHSMADASFRKLGAQLLIGEGDVSAIEKGTRITGYYLLGPMRALLPNMPDQFPATKVDWPLADGEEVHLGNKVLVVIATPGHTPGSVCFFLEDGKQKVLFSGDTILYDNRLAAMLESHATNNPQYVASLAKLSTYKSTPTETVRWDLLLPGHGTIVLDRGYMDVLKGWITADRAVAHGQAIEALPFASETYRMMMFGRP